MMQRKASWKRVMPLSVVLVGFIAAGCDGDASGPRDAFLTLAIRPVFTAAGGPAAAGIVDIARTRVPLTRADETTALDSMLPVAPEADSMPDPGVGTVVAGSTVGGARIVAALLTGPADTVLAGILGGNLSLIFHASGISDFFEPESLNSGRWLEIVDPIAQVVFPPLAVSRGDEEIVGLRVRPRPQPGARHLMTVDVDMLSATVITQFPERGVADITFTSDGTVCAVTGDGADVPETLWSVDLTTAEMSVVMALGNGDDGEAIAAVPPQSTAAPPTGARPLRR